MRIYSVTIDESAYWSEEIKKRVRDGKIYGRYIYTPDSRTHCCELTPSYELWFVGSVFEPLENATENEREALYDEIREADALCDNNDVRYFHCHDIDKMEKVKKHSVSLKVGRSFQGHFKKSEYVDNNGDFSMNEVLDWFNSNSCLV